MTEFTKTTLDGVLIVTPKRFGDHRELFGESFGSLWTRPEILMYSVR
ncbi:hypothetical protein [Pseudoruegeria sp. HB172150]|nr:hypothetical protein [Pseudoruegeria sp. HB172150]